MVGGRRVGEKEREGEGEVYAQKYVRTYGNEKKRADIPLDYVSIMRSRSDSPVTHRAHPEPHSRPLPHPPSPPSQLPPFRASSTPAPSSYPPARDSYMHASEEKNRSAIQERHQLRTPLELAEAFVLKSPFSRTATFSTIYVSWELFSQ